MDAMPAWQKHEGESSRAYSAFLIFRNLGRRRSLSEASRAYHGTGGEGDKKTKTGRKSSGLIRGWAERWNWKARAEAWDAEQQRLEDEALQVQRIEMAKRHAQQAKALQFKAIERLAKLSPDD